MSIPGKNARAGEKALAANGSAYYGSDPADAAALLFSDVLEAVTERAPVTADEVVRMALDHYEKRARW